MARGITKGAKANRSWTNHFSDFECGWNVGRGPINILKIQEEAAEWRAEKAKEKEKRANEGKDKPKEKEVPQKARDIADKVGKNKEGNPPDGYKGGKEFKNDGRNGQEKLPEGTKYREYDVNKYEQGQDRGEERIVIGFA